jgi:hypothetical protein
MTCDRQKLGMTLTYTLAILMFSILIICIGYSITDDPVIACRYDKKKNKIGDYTVDRQSVSIDNNIISCKIINYYSNYFIIKVEDYINNTFKFVDYVVDKNVIKPNLKNYIYNPIQLTTSSQNKYPYFISDMDSNKFMENKYDYVYFQSKINIKNYVNIYTLDDSSPYISNNTKVRIEFIYNSILTIDIEDNVIGIKGTVNNETNNQTIIIYKIKSNKIGTDQSLSNEELNSRESIYLDDKVCMAFIVDDVKYFLYLNGNNILSAEKYFNYDKRFIFKIL